MSTLCIFAILVTCTRAEGQPMPPPAGSVTGHVTCSDTQKPARFGNVYLLPKEQTPPPKEQPQADNNIGASPRGAKETKSLMLLTARTGMDGSFAIQRVPPGDYYILANMPGYILPINIMQAKSVKNDGVFDEPDLSVVLADIPVVHVQADRAASIELTMQRGGVIAGHVLFDDGTPVTSMFVTAIPEDGRETMPMMLPPGLQSIFRDHGTLLQSDDGGFRLTGLLPGKYRVKATVLAQMEKRLEGTSQEWGESGSGMSVSHIDIYAPDRFRPDGARIVEIKGAEQQTAVDFRLKLDSLHTVRGRVLAGADLHPVRGGWMILRDQQVPSLASAHIKDGEYQFGYVAEGNYKLTVAEDEDETPGVQNEEAGESNQVKTVPWKSDTAIVVGSHDLVVDDIVLKPYSKPAP